MMETCFCFGCGVEIAITPKRRMQLKHGRRIYCSRECFSVSNGHVVGGHKGTCANCGIEFVSRTAGKKYCSLQCYNSDPETIRRLKAISADGIAAKCKKRGINSPGKIRVQCSYCKADIEVVKSRLKRTQRFFCSQLHYRQFLSDNFDSWIATQVSVDSPQNYDEFMAQSTLPCPVDGCGWSGKFLSAHVSNMHGIPAAEFKMLAGFNLGTGLVAHEVSEKMSRSAIARGNNWRSQCKTGGWPTNPRGYYSDEGKEHVAKAIALRSAARVAKG